MAMKLLVIHAFSFPVLCKHTPGNTFHIDVIWQIGKKKKKKTAELLHRTIGTAVPFIKLLVTDVCCFWTYRKKYFSLLQKKFEKLFWFYDIRLDAG